MLRTFLTDFKGGGDYPDIITGWNVNGYDMPYLVNRMKTMFGEEVWSRLSPFGRIYDKKALFYGQEYLNVDIRGITILDYYELYRKFTLSQQERYTLDHIAHVVLKKRKVSYAEHRSLDQLYRKDYQKFIEYNITDVKLVAEIDGKLKLIELVAALAYTAKSNFADTFKQVRLWDVMIYHKLRSLNQQIPPRKQETKTEQYAGAFVKDPLVGMHEWVVSFDVASMYPHIIREWNLSPEMLIDRINVGSVEDFLTRKVDVTSVIQPYGDVASGRQWRAHPQGQGGLPPQHAQVALRRA
jgi:DNA polymerase elongation subunit (family B)